MSETTQTRAPVQTIPQAMGPKRRSKLAVAADVRALQRRKAEVAALYAGGSAAEEQANQEAQAELDLRIRQAQLRRRGRRIDLPALVQLHGASGPQWSVANLFGKVSEYAYVYNYHAIEGAPNGVYIQAKEPRNGNPGHPCGIAVAQRIDSRRRYDRYHVLPCQHGEQVLIPAAVPPIPARARAIADAAHADTEVAWVGVLYQPSEWLTRQPDPAIVVEYFDLPGEYYALCVWGGDRAQIMEFVD